MNAHSRYAAALLVHQHAVYTHGRALIAALQTAGYAVDPVAAPRTYVRLARSCAQPDVAAALREFETAVRPSLMAVVQACKLAKHVTIDQQGYALIEHFNRFTEVPVTATRIQRVVIWLRRTLRAIREACGHDQH